MTFGSKKQCELWIYRNWTHDLRFRSPLQTLIDSLKHSPLLHFTILTIGQYDQSFWPHCWYPWVMLCLIPALFIAGMVVQSCKTGKGSDHRQGVQTIVTIFVIALESYVSSRFVKSVCINVSRLTIFVWVVFFSCTKADRWSWSVSYFPRIWRWRNHVIGRTMAAWNITIQSALSKSYNSDTPSIVFLSFCILVGNATLINSYLIKTNPHCSANIIIIINSYSSRTRQIWASKYI